MNTFQSVVGLLLFGILVMGIVFFVFGKGYKPILIGAALSLGSLIGIVSVTAEVQKRIVHERQADEYNRRVVERAFVEELLTGKPIQLKEGYRIPQVVAGIAQETGFSSNLVRQLIDPHRYILHFNTNDLSSRQMPLSEDHRSQDQVPMSDEDIYHR